jgi:hypothetical protein
MELSLFLDIITAVAVILGILFGLLQLRHYHLSRQREADLFLLNSFQTEEFFQGIWLIQQFPKGQTKQQIEERLDEETKSIYLVMSTWERIGLLVFNHEISFDLVNEAYSDQIIISWQKLKKYVIDLRVELERETTFEWFQWLAERTINRETSDRPAPAYLAYTNWE